MSKVRVHELAKELGVTSKDVLAKLQELGEFVKSASSTVEAPVARRLREAMPAAGEKPAAKKAGKKAAPAAAEAAPAMLRHRPHRKTGRQNPALFRRSGQSGRPA